MKNKFYPSIRPQGEKDYAVLISDSLVWFSTDEDFWNLSTMSEGEYHDTCEYRKKKRTKFIVLKKKKMNKK